MSLLREILLIDSHLKDTFQMKKNSTKEYIGRQESIFSITSSISDNKGNMKTVIT